MTASERPSLDRFFRRRVLAAAGIGFVLIALIQLVFIANASRSAIHQTLSVQAAMTLRLAAQKDGNMNIDPATLPQWQVNPQLLVGCIVDKENSLLASVGGLKVTEAAEVNRLCQQWVARETVGMDFSTVRFAVSILGRDGKSMGRLILIGQMNLSWGDALLALVWSAILTLALTMAFFLSRNKLSGVSTPPSTK